MKTREEILAAIANLSGAMEGGRQQGYEGTSEMRFVWGMREALRWACGEPSEFTDLVKMLEEVE